MKYKPIFPILILGIMLLALVPSLSLPTHAGPTYLRIGGGTGPVYSTYTESIVIQSSVTTSVVTTVEGCAMYSYPWLNPGYLCKKGTALKILSNAEYVANNVSFSLCTCKYALNVTFKPITACDGCKMGMVAIGYGARLPAPDEGNYAPKPPYCPDGIFVILEKGAMKCYQLFLFYDGKQYLNKSVGLLTKCTPVTLGFCFTPPNHVVVYYKSGSTSLKCCLSIVCATCPQHKAIGLLLMTHCFVVDAYNGGPVYGYSCWLITCYVYWKKVTTPAYTAKISWTSVTLSDGINALYGFVGADNPVNVSTNASYSIQGIVNVKNFSVSGSSYPVLGKVSYVTKSNGLYLLLDMFPEKSLSSWYLNITFEFEFITPQETVYKNVTIPVVPYLLALCVAVKLPCATYLSGQVICITNSTAITYPQNLGYAVASYPCAKINIQGVTNGYVPLPFEKAICVQTPTTYTYIIIITIAGMEVCYMEGSFTVYPTHSQPVIFVSQVPLTAHVGQKITLIFQFSYNGPIANVTSSAFQKASTFEYVFGKLYTPKALLWFNGLWTSDNGGFIVMTESTNYLLPFNATTGVHFVNDTTNQLEFIVVNNEVEVLDINTGSELTIANNSPVIGFGFYYGGGNVIVNWVYVDGIILQSATANQAYTVLTGTSVNSLTQYTSGYTNASGYGTVTLTLTDTPYELVEIYWSGVTYILLNITVNSAPTSTTTTNTSCNTLSYNYTKPFSNNISPNSQLFNFSSYQPWATIIGVVVIALVVLLGWKFGGNAGASGGAMMGLIASAYLGLIPWYIFYIFVFAVALLLAKILVDKFMGGEVE